MTKNIITSVLLLINALVFGQQGISIAGTSFQNTDTIYSTPYIDGVSFLKVRTNNKESIYLSVSLYSTSAVEGQTGVNLLLDNGKAINKPMATITVKPVNNGNSYIYSSLIEMNEKDIALLSQYGVFRFKLYIYYNEVKEREKLKDELVKLLTKI
jgi:hypothetical protein